MASSAHVWIHLVTCRWRGYTLLVNSSSTMNNPGQLKRTQNTWTVQHSTWMLTPAPWTMWINVCRTINSRHGFQILTSISVGVSSLHVWQCCQQFKNLLYHVATCQWRNMTVHPCTTCMSPTRPNRQTTWLDNNHLFAVSDLTLWSGLNSKAKACRECAGLM